MNVKEINGFENYQINDSGINERSVWSIKRGKWMKPTQLKNGYLLINFNKEGKKNQRYLHRLIAEAFIDNPDNKPEIDHINGVRDDNRVENLKWVSHKENMRNPLTIKKMKISNKGKCSYKLRVMSSILMKFKHMIRKYHKNNNTYEYPDY